MIILRTLAEGVWSHFGVRFTEWLGAVPLLGMGYVLFMQPGTLWLTPSFATLARWATEPIWMNTVLAVGILRLLALIVNGSFKSFRYSPTIRFAASCVAALFWMLFLVGIYTAWRDAGGSPTGLVAYGTFFLQELRNAWVSRVDMAVTRGLAHARAYR